MFLLFLGAARVDFAEHCGELLDVFTEWRKEFIRCGPDDGLDLGDEVCARLGEGQNVSPAIGRVWIPLKEALADEGLDDLGCHVFIDVGEAMNRDLGWYLVALSQDVD